VGLLRALPLAASMGVVMTYCPRDCRIVTDGAGGCGQVHFLSPVSVA
jgi:hypothetical protein